MCYYVSVYLCWYFYNDSIDRVAEAGIHPDSLKRLNRSFNSSIHDKAGQKTSDDTEESVSNALYLCVCVRQQQ